jgi:hypothetical protein
MKARICQEIAVLTALAVLISVAVMSRSSSAAPQKPLPRLRPDVLYSSLLAAAQDGTVIYFCSVVNVSNSAATGHITISDFNGLPVQSGPYSLAPGLAFGLSTIDNTPDVRLLQGVRRRRLRYDPRKLYDL